MTAAPLEHHTRSAADGEGGDVLTVRDLTVTVRDTTLVDGVDLSIGSGERVGLIGESGSGKSLTALAVMGLLPEDVEASGSVRLAGVGHDLVGADERRMARVRGRDIAMVFQEPMTALNPTMRVGDQVAEAMLIHRTRPDRRSARTAAVELLDQVGLPDPGDAARAYPHQLSGGQRQRVVVALALANDPALLVCDEPTTALDVTVQALVLDLIVRGVTARDAALLFITHDLAVVATVCHRVLVMYGGRVVEAGPVHEVFTRPGTATPRGCSVPPTSTRSTSAVGWPPSRAPSRAPATSRPAVCSATAAPTPRPPASRRRPGAVRTRRRASPATTPPAGPTSRRWCPVAEQPPALSVRDVTRDYTRPRTSLLRPGPVVHALRGVSFDVAPGERFGIVGRVGLRQVHAATDPGRARPPHLRQRPGRRHRHRRAARAPAAVPARAAAAGLPGPDELARPPHAGA